MEVLGIAVPDELVDCWRRWLAPPLQPFVVDDCWDIAGEDIEPSVEDNDTFRLWRIDKAARLVWLSEEAFHALTPAARAELVRLQVRARRAAVPSVRAWSDLLDPRLLRSHGDGHRFVWSPSLLRSHASEIVRRVVTSELPLASRHAEVRERMWRECAEVLPGARGLAGTFARGSGPNCFGTVMGAAGVCRRGGRADAARALRRVAGGKHPSGWFRRPGRDGPRLARPRHARPARGRDARWGVGVREAVAVMGRAADRPPGSRPHSYEPVRRPTPRAPHVAERAVIPSVLPAGDVVLRARSSQERMRGDRLSL